MFNLFSKTDMQIQQDVIKQINWDRSITSFQVVVDVCDGIVTLKGRVPHFFEKSKAADVAQRVRGVKAVSDEIDVVGLGMADRSDEQILDSAFNALDWSYSVPKGILVTVDRGWITLSGEVDWDYQRVAAKNAVGHLMGVRGVTNRVAIKSRSLPAEIKILIENAIEQTCLDEGRKIAVAVEGYKATLTGYVYSIAELNAACQAAWMAPGILTVENNLQISQ